MTNYQRFCRLVFPIACSLLLLLRVLGQSQYGAQYISQAKGWAAIEQKGTDASNPVDINQTLSSLEGLNTSTSLPIVEQNKNSSRSTVPTIDVKLQALSEGLGSNTSYLPIIQKNNETTKYLCIGPLWAGNSNKILELARGKKKAEQLGFELAVVDSESYGWYNSWFGPSPHVTLPAPNETLHCVKNMTGKEIFYAKFDNPEGIPYLPQIPKYFLPRKDLRERAQQALVETYGKDPILTVHRRSMSLWRANKYWKGQGGANCSKLLSVAMVNLSYAYVQANLNPRNLSVVLFTDGLTPALDSTFPVIDSHNFTEQIWMMASSDEHVGIPVSTVDMIVNHWRYAQGNRNISPHQCYWKFKEEYAMDPSHFS
ncbi:unnamed protein product [Cylindrotheca closterium]|uniref:Uncharacterized protein n=1 Tax=Cylindrotheca closterium TaxID=2856 RepID=A0AAD2CIV1_9STRA|nr:unnamed protein product [Cylindrotheca closterium]